MSPEQARGQQADRRADVWAFGCVLFEMLAGQRAFAGDAVADTLAFVLTKEPAWSALPAGTPDAMARLLRRCLSKDPTQRLRDMGDARLELDEAAATPASGAYAPTGIGRREILAWTATGAASLATLGLWRVRENRAAPPVPTHLSLPVRPAREVARELQFPNARPFRHALAWSPDGKSLVFVGESPGAETQEGALTTLAQIYVRRLDQPEATPIPGTHGAQSPFFSPDGQWLGFWVGSVNRGQVGELKKVPVRGGPVELVCRMALPAGMSWGDNGRIVFATLVGVGLWHVSEDGGTPQALTTVNQAGGEVAHRLPQVLPGGEAVLFSVQKTTNAWDDADIVVRSLVTGEQRVLVEGAADARYVAPSHLVFARMGTILAQPFDLRRLNVRGTPVAMVDDVMQDVNSRFGLGNTGAAQFTVSSTGTLAYLRGGAPPEGTYRPMWVDCSGAETPLKVPSRNFGRGPRFSPDGRHVLFALTTGVGILDLERQTLRLVTPAEWGPPAFRLTPTFRAAEWHPDGRLTFTGVGGNLVLAAADGSGAFEHLTPRDGESVALGRIDVPNSWSRNGTVLAFARQVAGRRDIWTLSVGPPPTARPVVTTPGDEASAELSPDGRFLVYASDQSGQSEVYVQPYPGPGTPEPISVAGGSQPMWSRDRKELFYVEHGPAGTFRMMVVNVTLGEAFSSGRPRLLFEKMAVRYPAGGEGRRLYDVTADGRRFIMVAQEDDAAQPPITEVVLIQHWLEDVKRLVPAD